MATLERPYHLAVVRGSDIHLYTENGQLTDMRFIVGALKIEMTVMLRNGTIACVDEEGFLWIWDPKKPYVSSNKIELWKYIVGHVIRYSYQLPNDDICFVRYNGDVIVTIVNMTEKTVQQCKYLGGLGHLQCLSDGRLASVCKDGRIYVGDVRKGTGMHIVEKVDAGVWIYRCTGLVALTKNRLACRFEPTTTRNIYIYEFDNNETFLDKLIFQSAPDRMCKLSDNELIVSKYDFVYIWNLDKRTFVTFVLRDYFFGEFYGVNNNQILFECRDPWSSEIRVWDWTKQTGPEIQSRVICQSIGVKKCGWLPNGNCFIVSGDNHLGIQDLQTQQNVDLQGSAIYAVHTLSDDQWIDKMVATKANLITYFPRELCNMVAMYI